MMLVCKIKVNKFHEMKNFAFAHFHVLCTQSLLSTSCLINKAGPSFMSLWMHKWQAFAAPLSRYHIRSFLYMVCLKWFYNSSNLINGEQKAVIVAVEMGSLQV